MSQNASTERGSSMQEGSPMQQGSPMLGEQQTVKMANPLWFVPVLYFMQAVPNVLVTESFTGIFKDMGVGNADIALWTSIVALPWAFKLFWGPLVDLTLTKRTWTLWMEGTLFVLLLACGAAMNTAFFFPAALAALFLIAVCSATHDIACDGLYLMSLDRKQQAAYSGFMAMSSRIGRLFTSFVVVWVGGQFHEMLGWNKGFSWSGALAVAAVVYGAGWVWNMTVLPRPKEDVKREIPPGELQSTILRTVLVVASGVAIYFVLAPAIELLGKVLFDAAAGKGVLGGVLGGVMGGVKLPASWDMLGENIRNQLIILVVSAVALVPLAIGSYRSLKGTLMGEAFGSYMTQSGFFWILTFIVFYRFGEAMIFKMVMPFLQDPIEVGGMGLTVAKAAQIHGIGGPAGLIVGGLLGGWFISKVGIRRAFWPLVVCMHTPNLLYLFVAYEHAWVAQQSLTLWGGFSLLAWPMYIVAFVEAMGYGFGFAGYFVYLMWVAQRGRFTTSHYAIGTGLGALFITFAGIAAGLTQSVLGWMGFFIVACLFTIPGTLTLLFIPLEKDGGKGMKAASDH